MKNSGLKNEAQVAKILVSGSSVLTQKNSAGVRLFRESDLGDGIISGKLIRPKYNNDELKKSIDTEIFELLPQEAPQLPDMVLRSVYNVATQSIEDLTLQVQQLTTEVSTLNSKVSELEIVSESLKIEADNQILKANISEQQALTANEQVATTTLDLTNAIQNSINEAIERVSLTAQNEALKRETELLRDQLFGKDAQIAAGAQAAEDFAVRVLSVENNVYPNALIYQQRANKATKKWVNGPKVEISNFTDESVTVTFKVVDISMITAPGPRTIPAGDKIQIDFENFRNSSWIDSQKPKGSAGFTGDTEYTGTLEITSPLATLSVGLRLQKYRGKKFG